MATIRQHEAEGTLEHPEYKGAIAILNYRHLCRLQEWPAVLLRAFAGMNMAPYLAIQGPNEFCYTGSIVPDELWPYSARDRDTYGSRPGSYAQLAKLAEQARLRARYRLSV
jgi:hypothetical protein